MDRFLSFARSVWTPTAKVLARVIWPLALCGIAIRQLWPGLSQNLAAPISFDHGAHLGKAIQTAHELLPFLRGWSDNVELGVPLNAFYTPSGTIFILLVRAVTPWLEWVQTYALTIAAFRCLVALSVYRLARASGAVRFAAFVAGVIMLADTGDHSEGGWFYDVLYGVWPMSLGVTVFFFALADLMRFVEEGQRKHGARAMLLLGIALFSHQMVLLGSLTVLPMLLFGRWLDTHKLKEPAFRIASVFAVGMLIAAWWLFPVLATTRWLDDHGQLYIGIKEMGTRAMSGAIAPNMGVWTGVLFVIALLAAFFSRGARRFLALATALMLVLATRDWLVESDGIGILPAFGRIMYPRFMMLAKPMGFALTGLLLSDVITRAKHELHEQKKSSVVITWLVVIAFVAPFTTGVWKKTEELMLTRDVPTTATRNGFGDYMHYAEWMRSQPRDRFFRVAYSDASSHIFQSAAAFTDRPAHKMGMLIAEAFGNVSASDDVEALRAMNVRYLVFWGSPNLALVRHAHRVETFGPIAVYELDGWNSRIVLDGAQRSRPTVRNLEHERLVIDANGTTDLIVRRAAGPGWRATADGKAITIHEERMQSAPELRLIRLHLPAGTRRVELRYRTLDAIGAVALVLSVLGVLLTLLVATGTLAKYWAKSILRARARAWIEGIPHEWRSGARPWLLVVIVIAIALIVVVARRPYRLTPASREARVQITSGGTTQECTEAREEGGHACAGRNWLAVGPTIMAVEGRLRSCVTAHAPVDGDVLRATFEHVPLTRALHVGAGISDEAGAGEGSVELRVRANGRDLGKVDVSAAHLWYERTLVTQPGDARVEIEIVTHGSNSQRWFCFDARTAGSF